MSLHQNEPFSCLYPANFQWEEHRIIPIDGARKCWRKIKQHENLSKCMTPEKRHFRESGDFVRPTISYTSVNKRYFASSFPSGVRKSVSPWGRRHPPMTVLYTCPTLPYIYVNRCIAQSLDLVSSPDLVKSVVKCWINVESPSSLRQLDCTEPLWTYCMSKYSAVLLHALTNG